MSHYTVLVTIPGPCEDVDAELHSILAPYDERTEDSQYQEFEDEEDDLRWKYKNEMFDGNSEYIRKGHNKYAWKRPCEVYETFEQYAKKWHGAEKDFVIGRYGYWHNPNSKWDWWVIGGRWSGQLRSQDGSEHNVLQRKDLDLTYIDQQVEVKSLDLRYNMNRLKEYNSWKKIGDAVKFGSKDHWTFCDAWEKMLMCGFVKELKSKEDEYVFNIPGIEELKEDYRFLFHPYITYAALNDKGWGEPGEMGWWGCSHAESKDKFDWKRKFHNRYISSGKPSDVLVIVDCHI